MNSTTFNCPSCSQPLSLPPTFTGPQVQCPSCQTVISLPNAPQATALTPLAAQPLTPTAAVPTVSMAPPATVMDKETEKSIGKMSIETTEHTGEMTSTRKLFLKLTEQVSKIFIGQDELVLGTLVSLFSSGHVLIESVPGLGKTLFVRVLGHALGCDFGRIQFTADLMPSDVTGAPVFNMKTQEFKFHPGPVFTQLLLADEINRSPAKTHAALLEIMQEHRVTVDGTSYPIAPPFIVIATQNPVEQEGTYNLPEAQLDRFMMKLIVNYPNADQEANILKMHSRQESISDRLQTEIETVTTPEEINAVIKQNGEKPFLLLTLAGGFASGGSSLGSFCS